VGSHCLRLLAASTRYARVIALTRRSAGLNGDRVTERVVDFSRLDPDLFDLGADIFCAVGTTIRKAGSQSAFRNIDFDIPVELARAAAQAGARQFSVVSSVGAISGTSNFYLKTKADMEAAVAAQGFQAVHVFRPSFLIGKRHEARPGERVGVAIARVVGLALVGPLRKYRAIGADTVSAAMVGAAAEHRGGVHVYHYDDMLALSASARSA
jgi:uncharacterized protein YbjT (DUF2867 family)